MCGIAGFTHKNWTPPPERIREAVATLRHRGPDQQGVFPSRSFSFAAARLKIIDLEGGNQPILANQGESGIVFNGEIYNHQEIRAELEGLGHRFDSHSDTETVLKAFLQWDKDCLSRLRGMFAFAIWDESCKRVLLARDRTGIKPLYIARRGEDLFFASELKAIFVHPEIERNLSLKGLDCYLAMNYVPWPWTLVDGIEKLPPGYWMEWLDGRVTSESYWTLPCGNPRPLSLESAKEGLDDLLKKAVKEHLLSDVPLGIWLSGGVDSTTILHYAASASSTCLKTFSISFRGRSFDETPYLRQAVAQYGTDHQEFDLNPTENLLGAIEEFAYYSDEPSADAGALPVWFLSKLCKAQTTVALSGEGADELFGGYLTYRANGIAEKLRLLPKSMLRAALRATRGLPVSDEKISFEYKAKRMLEGALMSPERAHVYWNGTFSDEQKRTLLKVPLPSGLEEILAEARKASHGKSGLAEYLWFDQRYYLADDILTKSDRMSMAHSIEVRPAFLDHRIVEFAAALPAHLKIRGSRQKILLKELMKARLPRGFFDRPKVGLDIPSHEWMRGPLRDLLLETVALGLREYGDFFQAAAINSLIKRHMDREINAGYHLWGLLILFLWMKKWKIQVIRSPAPRLHSLAAAGLPLGQ